MTSGISAGATTARTGACCSSPRCRPAIPISSRGCARAYAGRIAQLRRRFEALRARTGSCGASTRRGHRLRRRGRGLCRPRQRIEPSEPCSCSADAASGNIAVMFMDRHERLDQGWIQRLRARALVLLCEALEALGDRYAIYGFFRLDAQALRHLSHQTFGEPYGEAVARPHCGVEPRDYTRMGVAIPGIFAASSRRSRRRRASSSPCQTASRRFSRRLPRRLRHRGPRARR